VLGVFGEVDSASVGSLLEFHGYASSVNKPNLVAIEELLRKLWSPRLPPEISAIDESLRAPGAALFKQHCAACHADINREDPNRKITASMKIVGTDPTMARNVAMRTAKTGILKGRLVTLRGSAVFGPTAQATDLLKHLGERIIVRPDADGSVLSAMDKFAEANYSQEYTIHARLQVGEQKIEGAFHQLQFEGNKIKSARSRSALKVLDAKGAAAVLKTDVVKTESLGGEAKALTMAEAASAEFAYKGRPLNGIWATAPYLHNGSIPNLDELLKPAKDRIKTFHVGSREFDPVKVGFVDEGEYLFDTTLPGNSNAGHEYGSTVFTEAERRQLIEYMKSL
jgi:hypothetical protein